MLDNNDHFSQSFGSSTMGGSYTSTGANLAMVVVAAYGTDGVISDVTYNGVSLGSPVYDLTNGAANTRQTGYVLAGPATGAHALTLTWTTPPNTSTAELSVSTWTGINQSTPNRTAATQVLNFNTALSTSVSNAQSGDILVDGLTGGNGSITADASQTVILVAPGAGQSWFVGNTYKVASGPTTVDWSASSVGIWAHGVIPLIPASGGSAFFGRIYYDMIGQAR